MLEMIKLERAVLKDLKLLKGESLVNTHCRTFLSDLELEKLANYSRTMRIMPAIILEKEYNKITKANNKSFKK